MFDDMHILWDDVEAGDVIAYAAGGVELVLERGVDEGGYRRHMTFCGLLETSAKPYTCACQLGQSFKVDIHLKRGE